WRNRSVGSVATLGADLDLDLSPLFGVLEDRRHHAGTNVENLVLNLGEELTVGEVVAQNPVEGLQRRVEGPAKVGQLVEGGSLDAAAVQVTNDEAVTLSPAQRIGEDLVGNAVQSIVEVLVAQAPASQLCEHSKGPPACQQFGYLAPKSMASPSVGD